MKKKDKELLLKDLSARLRYGVKCQHFDDKTPYALLGIDEDVLHLDCPVYDEGDGYVEIEYCKPYLRPMGSMTEEERFEVDRLFGSLMLNINTDIYFVKSDPYSSYISVYQEELNEYFDWLNKHHFDYHGLIEKGLAIEATEGMYDTK